ncbi:MAG: rRNA maturation RNase YbeY [Ignavibacteria bacterium]|nr:rRNA maturation RNase YbeY [Ignavibacteria bacterium]
METTVKINIFNESKIRAPRKVVVETLKNVLLYFKQTNFVLNIVYVDEDTILELNRSYLSHNYLTDVISFDLSTEDSKFGEIYICVQQAQRQAQKYRVTFTNEILRLAIHGALHLLGFSDKDRKSKVEMTKFENLFLREKV